jgi:bacteriophage exclusion system BrxC/D-like protein
MSQSSSIRPRERDTILQSLRAGVVPRTGLPHIQVGRVNEVNAIIKDLDRVGDGGCCLRLIIGEYGSGKTFFLSLARAIALEKKLVTAHADLTPDRRLYGTGGEARSLYAELLRTLSTRAKPEGGALASVVERFIMSAEEDAQTRGVKPEAVMWERLTALSEMTGGYDFTHVVAAWWRGYAAGDDALQSSALRWLRGEFTTKTDARAALGVRTIVDDHNWYDQLKLLARFMRLAGYAGFLVCLDELVNLFKLAHTKARNTNYEQVLRILNDCLQGDAVGLGFLFGGTPEFLLDPRKGLHSYPALQSRLVENTFAAKGLIDFSGPVLRLANLLPEDLFVLLQKLRHVQASGDPARHLVPDEALRVFMGHCAHRIGDAYFRTPRTTITAFVNFLAVLEQNPQASWQALLGTIDVPRDDNPDLAPIAVSDRDADLDDDNLASFKL